MSINPYNEQVALARQVLTVFDSDKLIEQLRVFVQWVAEAEDANKDPSQRLQELQHQEFETADDTRRAEGGYLRKKKELDAIVETSPQKTTRGVSVRRKHLRELKRKYDRLHDKLNALRAEIKDVGALLEPNPWTLLVCSEPTYSTDAHITKLVRFLFPSGRVCELNASRWACLLCVRLSILHDSVLPNDYPQLTAKVLDKERVDSVWRDMSRDWLTWRQVLEYDIKRLQSDTDTQGLLKTIRHIDQKPNGLGEARETRGDRPRGGIPSQPISQGPIDIDTQPMEWDVFISHASEDNEAFVRPLAIALQKKNIRVWFDEFTLTVGDSLRGSIDRGLASSRYGIVVISPDFLKKDWPQKELDGLIAQEGDGRKVILPVWHNVDGKTVRQRSPILAGRVATSTAKGVDAVVADLMKAMK